MKLKQKSNLILTFVLLVAVLAVKIICFVRGYPEHYKDAVESALSGAYYVLMLGLCFFAGREKWGFSILLCVLLTKLLIFGVTALTQWEPLIVVFCFLGASHYLVNEMVSGLEGIGETFPDIIYWSAYLLVYLCFAFVARLSKELAKEKVQ